MSVSNIDTTVAEFVPSHLLRPSLTLSLPFPPAPLRFPFPRFIYPSYATNSLPHSAPPFQQITKSLCPRESTVSIPREGGRETPMTSGPPPFPAFFLAPPLHLLLPFYPFLFSFSFTPLLRSYLLSSSRFA